ncbi:MAG: metalloregulator ArsR/SmtB family transcription factor [Candidatus Limnocylindrales bacterium]
MENAVSAQSADRPNEADGGSRAAKTELHEAFALVGKALANPHRLEMLDLLAQGERSVEVLAGRADISVALASAHLQALRRAGLVASRRDGNRIVYRLASDDVYRLLTALRTVAGGLGEAEQAVRRLLGTPVEAVGREELLARVRTGDAVVIDLRPAEEYEAGHISGALSIPLSELEARLAELPADIEIVAYCRGPYCAISPEGVALLERHGRRARRLEDGFPEWRLAGLPVLSGREGGR